MAEIRWCVALGSPSGGEHERLRDRGLEDILEALDSSP